MNAAEDIRPSIVIEELRYLADGGLLHDEDEMAGAAIAAAAEVGDWCETFEFIAMGIVDRHAAELLPMWEVDPVIGIEGTEAGWAAGIAWLSGGEVFVRRSYSGEYTAEAHQQRGRRWNADVQAWSFPHSTQLGTWLDRWGIVCSDQVKTRCGMRPPTQPKPEPLPVPPVTPSAARVDTAPLPPPPMSVHEDEPGVWRVVGGTMREASWIGAVPGTAEIRKDGNWWLTIDPGLDPYEWVVDGVRLGVIGLEKWLMRLENDRRFATPTAAASRALRPSEGFTQAPGLAVELRPHQLAAVEYVVHNADRQRALIGDMMGLGKSLIALAVAEHLNAYPLLIVCPASLVINWSREVRKALPGRTVDMATTRSGVLGVADISIIGYEALQKRLNAALKVNWKMAVADEAHYLKNPRAARTSCAKLAFEGVHGVRLAMSGTFVKNKEYDVDTPLKIIGRPDIAEQVKADRANSSRLLRGSCMVRRTTHEVMPHLPPLQMVTTYVDPDPERWKEYKRAEADIINYVKERAEILAIERGEDPHSAGVEAALRAESAKYLVAISHLRRLAAHAKKDSAIQRARDFTESTTEPVILFAHHREVLEELGRTLKCDILMGGISQGERDAAVERFQSGNVPVIAVGFQAGGLGLTLTAASHMMLLEQQWTPADMDQAYGRCMGRINDAHGLVADHLVIEGSIDEDMLELIDQKRVMAKAALDGGDEAEADRLMNETVAGDLLVRILNK